MRALSSFIVSVPVLSDAMNVHDPSASTATRRRAMTFLRAIRRAPIDSETVSATGSPSGIAETASATASMNTLPTELPRATETAPSNTTATTTATPIRVVNRSIRTSSGGLAPSDAVSELAIRPICVASAVATTTPCARPRVTSVAANAMFTRSPSGVSAARRVAGVFVTVMDSPVRRDSSTSTPPFEISRTSAGTLYPASSTTMSPGTSSVASTSWSAPSRST